MTGSCLVVSAVWQRNFQVSTLRSDFQKSLDDVSGLQKDAYMHTPRCRRKRTVSDFVIGHQVEEFVAVCLHTVNPALKLT